MLDIIKWYMNGSIMFHLIKEVAFYTNKASLVKKAYLETSNAWFPEG